MAGEEVHEVAVGPVHAGIIEPGHFRFQCHGETVYHLEISLGYQHRGVERALVGGPGPADDALRRDAGRRHDHRPRHRLLPRCRSAGPHRVPPEPRCSAASPWNWNAWPTTSAISEHWPATSASCRRMSYCGRIRGDVLNMTAMLCGNRFGRGLVRPGGVAFDVDERRSSSELQRRLDAMPPGMCACAVELLWDTPVGHGADSKARGDCRRQLCEQTGSGGRGGPGVRLRRDVRQRFPLRHLSLRPDPGLDLAYRRRLRPRLRPLAGSPAIAGFHPEQLEALPGGPIRRRSARWRRQRLVVALVEGWRGEICHVATTDDEGRFAPTRSSIRRSTTGSAWRWHCANQQISDFPLCNKSFNLSYCGHDL